MLKLSVILCVFEKIRKRGYHDLMVRRRVYCLMWRRGARLKTDSSILIANDLADEARKS